MTLLPDSPHATVTCSLASHVTVTGSLANHVTVICSLARHVTVTCSLASHVTVTCSLTSHTSVKCANLHSLQSLLLGSQLCNSKQQGLEQGHIHHCSARLQEQQSHPLTTYLSPPAPLLLPSCSPPSLTCTRVWHTWPRSAGTWSKLLIVSTNQDRPRPGEGDLHRILSRHWTATHTQANSAVHFAYPNHHTLPSPSPSPSLSPHSQPLRHPHTSSCTFIAAALLLGEWLESFSKKYWRTSHAAVGLVSVPTTSSRRRSTSRSNRSVSCG